MIALIIGQRNSRALNVFFSTLLFISLFLTNHAQGQSNFIDESTAEDNAERLIDIDHMSFYGNRMVGKQYVEVATTEIMPFVNGRHVDWKEIIKQSGSFLHPDPDYSYQDDNGLVYTSIIDAKIFAFSDDNGEFYISGWLRPAGADYSVWRLALVDLDALNKSEIGSFKWGQKVKNERALGLLYQREADSSFWKHPFTGFLGKPLAEHIRCCSWKLNKFISK